MSTRQKRGAKASTRQTSKTDGVIDDLRRQYDQLTHSQKRIAEYIVDNPQSVAFATVDQMASELGINPSTIVRFTYRLGLKGFPDLQERARQLVRGQLSAASELVDSNSILSHLDGTIFGTSLSQDLQNLSRTISSLDVDTLSRACAIIGASRRIYVAGAFASYGVACYLTLALDRIHGNTILWGWNDGMVPSQTLDMQSNDCVIVFTAAPYAVATHRLALVAKEAGAKVIAVTDTPISAVGQLAYLNISAHYTGSGSQNSLVAPMAIAHALLNGVAGANSSRTLERYARLNRLVNRWDTFLLKGDELEERRNDDANRARSSRRNSNS